jgi:hypothetical protein
MQARNERESKCGSIRVDHERVVILVDECQSEDVDEKLLRTGEIRDGDESNEL